ncbi:MAG: branched-chain amino acid ABC transporter substrate-binding protein [Alphaproteobacteria bacterium]
MQRVKFANWLAAASILGAGALAATPALAVKVGPVDDPLGVVKVNKGQPITIGGYWVMSGADTALGLDSKRAVEVYFNQIGNKIAGHPIRFMVEDDGCNAEGGQTAGTKLAANQSIVGVLGPACSSAATAAAPILWKQGMVNIGTASSAPRLTAADRGPNFDGFARTIFSDAEQAKGDTNWMYNVNKWKTAATIHDGSPYAQQLVAEFKVNFEKAGGKVVAAEAISPTDVDMRPVLTRIATAKPEVVYYPVFVAAGGQITRQAKETAGLTKNLIGGGSMMTKDIITASGDAAKGFRITFPDVSKEAMGKEYPKLVAAYKKQFGEEPIQGFHAQAYDAAKLLVMAIEKVAVTDKDGVTFIGRKALRDAVFNAPEFDGMSGPIKCDVNGQCGKFKFAVYEFVNADASTFEIGKNPKKIFPTQ